MSLLRRDVFTKGNVRVFKDEERRNDKTNEG